MRGAQRPRAGLLQKLCRTCVAPCSLGPDATAACVRVGKVQMELGLFHCLSAALIPEPNVFQTWGCNARGFIPRRGWKWVGAVLSVQRCVSFRMLADLPSPGRTRWMTIKKIRSKKLYDTKVPLLSLFGVIGTWVCWDSGAERGSAFRNPDASTAFSFVSAQ